MIPAEYAAAAEEAAALAGAETRPLFRSALLVEAKGDASPVTEADRAAERALRGFLGTRFPDHGILGEEYGAERPDAEWLWVLDPIDGTRAFLTGRPIWGTLIGLMHRGEPVLGLIDQPVLGERWLGVKGQGTRFNGQPIRTRSCNRLAEAELACTAPEMFPEADRPGFEALRAGARRISWGGDCYLYGLLSLGLLDVVAEATLKPWDWAALVPVVEGAGGSMTGWNGEALRMGCDGRVLALGDPALLDEAKASLAGGGPRPQ
ncbi:inositol monophosphatase family protein [Sabulicella glaciei]|uniref:Inositol monophosphatase family protein n=1 Tax=Sabulicella glaciei TaxID=2984948 RepID=A0ABT3NSU4_9PROT|nr:inositol monophosphatase family protein [Roseococcus sp. MDT2-1-1]MCW8085225.1 inositol monophosphatase family protein [Roseococcus sp. MDT2-1-1]